MHTERMISIFNGAGDLVDEINIDSLDIKILKEIFISLKGDPELIYVYRITEREATHLQKYLKINFDFSKYTYTLDCFSVE